VTFTLVFTAVPQNLGAIEPLIASPGGRGAIAGRLKLIDRYTRPEAAGPVRTLRPVPLDPEAVQVVRGQGTEADYSKRTRSVTYLKRL
jgi:hypothetical protein